jgi:hypothetical protein
MGRAKKEKGSEINGNKVKETKSVYDNGGEVKTSSFGQQIMILHRVKKLRSKGKGR